MDYKIVNLEEKTLVGLNIRTNNNDPNMGKDIGELWQKFFEQGFFANIKNKVNDRAIGLYSNYESDYNGDYDMSVACEVSEVSNLQKDTIIKTISSGKYAKFIVKGHMQKAVYEFWQELWSMNLDRAYTYDFEEYVNAEVNNAEIHIYIALK